MKTCLDNHKESINEILKLAKFEGYSKDQILNMLQEIIKDAAN